MIYRIQGLDPAPFAKFFNAADDALRADGVERHTVAAKPSAPCRISLQDAEIGETVLLLSYEHHPAQTPYRQAGPIFIREVPVPRFEGQGVVPPALQVRVLSVRAFDAAGAMIDADVIDGPALKETAERLFANPAVFQVHAHYAKRGCFAAKLTRA